MKVSMAIIKGVLVTLSLGVILFAFGYWLYRVHTPCHGQRYTHLNESLQCDERYALDKSAFIRLEGDLNTLIQQQQELGHASEVSVYVRDLYNGPTLSINAGQKFAPASLLKVPMLLTYLRLKEEYGPSVFDTKLVYTPPEEEPAQLIEPESLIVPNQPYSVEELLRHMIIYSDNRAYLALLEYLHQLFPDHDRLLDTYIDLGILDPRDLSDQTLTTRTYASMFTQLFHASYLNERASSEWALDLLSQSTFKDGLVAGVPEGTEVAHKFGERAGLVEGQVQLHDCGVVYFPDNPYLICVMTEGDDIEQLEHVIAAISKAVYAEFDLRRYQH